MANIWPEAFMCISPSVQFMLLCLQLNIQIYLGFITTGKNGCCDIAKVMLRFCKKLLWRPNNSITALFPKRKRPLYYLRFSMYSVGEIPIIF